MSGSAPSGSPPDDGDLQRNSNAVAAGILLSRIAGLVREIVTARFLGTGVGAEAFRAALRVPNLMQNLLGEGVLSASFIPVYSRLIARGRQEDAARLVTGIASLLLVVVAVIVTATVVFARPITRLLAWGFVPGTARFETTVTLVRIMTPGVGLLVFSALCLAVLNSHRRFFLAYVAPVLWNAAIVAAVVAAALMHMTETGLAQAMGWGALAGSGAQALVQVPLMLRLAGPLRWQLPWRQLHVRLVVRRFGQVVVGRGGVQLAGYVDLLAASLLAFGAVAALGYAQVLYLLPISVFGISVAASELPTLSTLDHADQQRVRRRLNRGLSRVTFFVVPTMVCYLMLGDAVVATLLGGGRFGPDDAIQVGVILAVYSIGLLASTNSRLLQSVLYGIGDARRPAVYALVRVFTAGIVGVAAMLPLDAVEITAAGFRVVGDIHWAVAPLGERAAEANLLRMGAAGLAFGSVIGAWLEFALLRRRVIGLFGPVLMFGRQFGLVAVAAASSVATALLVRWWATTVTLPWRATGLLGVAACGLMYLAMASLLGVDEVRRIVRGASDSSE
ncbi:MAG: murein biosynthesis integral membrane protein MurJ [Nitriliruptoraceae bacterium]